MVNIEVKAAVAIETQVATPGVMVEAITASTAKPRLINSVSAVVALRWLVLVAFVGLPEVAAMGGWRRESMISR